MLHKIRHHSPLFLLVFSVGIFGILDALFVQYTQYFSSLNHDTLAIQPLFLVGALLLLGTICHSLSRGTIFPSFLVALFIGMSMHDLFKPLTENNSVLTLVVTIAAIYILFGGGLEISFANFKKILFPTLLLSFVGLFISTFLFAQGAYVISSIFGFGMSISISLLLGAILASTDPAAVIPVLKNLTFKRDVIKDIVISESAITDVTGTLVTVAFVSFLTMNGQFLNISDGLYALGSMESLRFLVKEICIGVCIGLIGFFAIRFFVQQRMIRAECHSDIGFFIAIPIVVYACATLLGGSGYLASFIAGLMAILNEKVHKTETFFNQLIDGIAKPTVFIVLGALVNIQTLFEYSLFGIMAGLLFIFVIRPISVFISIGSLEGFSLKELLFISWVRETGVIPAVLLIQVAYSGLQAIGSVAESHMLVSVGMWVIILTLVIQPPLTAWVAKKTEVTV